MREKLCLSQKGCFLKGLAQGLLVQDCGRLESREGGVEMSVLKSVHRSGKPSLPATNSTDRKRAVPEHKQELWKWQRKDRETHGINFWNLCFFSSSPVHLFLKALSSSFLVPCVSLVKVCALERKNLEILVGVLGPGFVPVIPLMEHSG